jgi:hypothetical protein
MAELNIRERQAGDVTVLDMDGKITIGEGSVALRSAVRRLIEEGKKKILLNLSNVATSIRRASASWCRASPRSTARADSSSCSPHAEDP